MSGTVPLPTKFPFDCSLLCCLPPLPQPMHLLPPGSMSRAEQDSCLLLSVSLLITRGVQEPTQLVLFSWVSLEATPSLGRGRCGHKPLPAALRTLVAPTEPWLPQLPHFVVSCSYFSIALTNWL